MNNRQNKNILLMLDEAKVLREKLNKYKDMPGRYTNVRSKYKDVKAEEKETPDDPFKIMIGKEELDEKTRMQMEQKVTEVKQKAELNRLSRNKETPQGHNLLIEQGKRSSVFSISK